MNPARLTAALAFLLGSGCGLGGSSDCALGCGEDSPVVLDLACGPTDLTGVTISGPCATGDASPSNYVWGPNSNYVSFTSASPGVCHVELTFATGFIYSADVTFAYQTSGTHECTPCPAFIAPTQSMFMVNDPNTTCVGAGVDAGMDE